MAESRCHLERALLKIELFGDSTRLWDYIVIKTGERFSVEGPVFEINRIQYKADLADIQQAVPPKRLLNETTEYRFEGSYAVDPQLSLEICFRISDDNPVIRFHYTLKCRAEYRLTKQAGKDALSYFKTSFQKVKHGKEIRVADFVETVHSYCLTEHPINERHYRNELSAMGPIVTGSNEEHAILFAYEHGSQYPDAFLHYQFDVNKGMELKAVKGNYFHSQSIDESHSFRTIWMNMAAITGDEAALAHAYRSFVLKYMANNRESRKPYIFYNTWAYQERNYSWNNKSYLESMHEERILAEIDVAFRMGIEVFVLDVGWFERTGDWIVNKERFSDNLKQVKERLDVYGMKLGLWFEPRSAAVSSQVLNRHQDCIMSWKGTRNEPHVVVETEESHLMCLVSRYADAFADHLIQLSNTLGIAYFKWDGIGQYGCDDPHHNHGTGDNGEQERADSYAFQIGLAMIHIVEKLAEACPDTIVDFDVTEGSRFVGLGFLSVGKYFLINNGPYYMNYDLPSAPKYHQANVAEDNVNLFFYPGPARSWICRSPLTYDKWIPSILFLTHYLPDDPEHSQLINLGSLILGQNGIWGDLLSVSNEGIMRIRKVLDGYKQVRDDMTQVSAVRSGTFSGNPEIYEKIDSHTSKGAVVIFASSFGKPYSTSLAFACTYITISVVDQNVWHNDGVSVTFDEWGHAVIQADFSEASAKIIFFGLTA